jgi:hypothetical protein
VDGVPLVAGVGVGVNNAVVPSKRWFSCVSHWFPLVK